MRSAFGQTRTRAAQLAKCARIYTNFVRIWSLLVGLTKCAAHLGKRAAQLAKCARVWPIARAIGQTRARFTKRCAIGQMRCAIAQMRRLVKCALQYH